MSSGDRWKRSAGIVLILCILLLAQCVVAQSDTTTDGPVTVSQCESGARCSGGDDSINGICNNPCEGRTNPFCAAIATSCRARHPVRGT